MRDFISDYLFLFLLLVFVLFFVFQVSAKQETCPNTEDGWTKIDSNDLSLYPVDGATEYCFKAGSDNSNGCTGGLFSSWPQEGACGLSHWSFYIPEPSPSVFPTSHPTELPLNTPWPTNTPEHTPTPEPTITSIVVTNTPEPTTTVKPTEEPKQEDSKVSESPHPVDPVSTLDPSVQYGYK